jgi:transposase InsO family protein
MGLGKPTTSMEQRLAIGALAQAGHADSAIARTLGLSQAVVRKWRRRGRAGAAGLVTQLGRPARGLLSSYAASVPELVRTLRQAHPGWGPITLRAELARQTPAAVPSRSQLAAYLKAQHWTRAYLPGRRLPSAPPPAAAPHAEWQMDAVGVQTLAASTPVVVINIGDPFTRLLTESRACLQISKACTADYQCALRRAFWRYGLPASLSLDHDTVFCDPTSASPYPTQLHLWLLALGVQVRFIDPGRPTQHGYIERTHQTIQRQVLADRHLEPAQLQARLDDRRQFLNATYPHHALDGCPPVTVFPAATHTGRFYAPEHETQLLQPQRVFAYLARGSWQRQVSPHGQFELGGQRYGLGAAWGGQPIHLTFDPQTAEFICQRLDRVLARRVPARGLTCADWIGDWPLASMPAYQLAFPWDRAERRIHLVLNDPPGTTFPDNQPSPPV